LGAFDGVEADKDTACELDELGPVAAELAVVARPQPPVLVVFVGDDAKALPSVFGRVRENPAAVPFTVGTGAGAVGLAASGLQLVDRAFEETLDPEHLEKDSTKTLVARPDVLPEGGNVGAWVHWLYPVNIIA